jgi:hypothetical protein
MTQISWEIRQKRSRAKGGRTIYKYALRKYRGLGNVRAMDRNWLHFAVKIDFEGKGSSVENRAAITAIAQVALHFAGNFWCQATFQVFADQTDRTLTGHAHGGPLSAEQHLFLHAVSQNL